MMRRREFLALIGAATLSPRAAWADQDRQTSYVGVLTGNLSSDPAAQMRVRAFRQGLADLGWIDDENLRLEVRWPGPTPARQEEEARELVAQAPDVILATSTQTTRALRDTTQTIPIVFVGLSDPVSTGIVSDLARPSGNITGFSLYEHSMSGKWLSLLKDIAPQLSHVTVLFNPETTPYASFYVQSAQETATRLALKTSSAGVRNIPEVEAAISGVAALGNGGLLVLPDGGFFAANNAAITGLAAKYRVPAVYAVRFYVVNGGLISYGADLTSQFRDGASYVNRILRGASPRDLPVQFATRFELAINMKAAGELGLTVPHRLMIDAELIE